jgi:hypothetical protein
MALGVFTVHAGDFRKGKDHQFVGGKLIMKKPKGFFRETIKLDRVESVEMASEEAVKRIAGTIGWGCGRRSLAWSRGPAGWATSRRQRHGRYFCMQTEGWTQIPRDRLIEDV